MLKINNIKPLKIEKNGTELDKVIINDGTATGDAGNICIYRKYPTDENGNDYFEEIAPVTGIHVTQNGFGYNKNSDLLVNYVITDNGVTKGSLNYLLTENINPSETKDWIYCSPAKPAHKLEVERSYIKDQSGDYQWFIRQAEDETLLTQSYAGGTWIDIPNYRVTKKYFYGTFLSSKVVTYSIGDMVKHDYATQTYTPLSPLISEWRKIPGETNLPYMAFEAGESPYSTNSAASFTNLGWYSDICRCNKIETVNDLSAGGNILYPRCGNSYGPWWFSNDKILPQYYLDVTVPANGNIEIPINLQDGEMMLSGFFTPHSKPGVGIDRKYIYYDFETEDGAIISLGQHNSKLDISSHVWVWGDFQPAAGFNSLQDIQRFCPGKGKLIISTNSNMEQKITADVKDIYGRSPDSTQGSQIENSTITITSRGAKTTMNWNPHVTSGEMQHFRIVITGSILNTGTLKVTFHNYYGDYQDQDDIDFINTNLNTYAIPDANTVLPGKNITLTSDNQYVPTLDIIDIKWLGSQYGYDTNFTIEFYATAPSRGPVPLGNYGEVTLKAYQIDKDWMDEY